MARTPRSSRPTEQRTSQRPSSGRHDRGDRELIPPDIINQPSDRDLEVQFLADQLQGFANRKANLRQSFVSLEESGIDQVFFEWWQVVNLFFQQNKTPLSKQIKFARNLLTGLEAEASKRDESSTCLPTSPPKRWESRDKSKRETAVEFVRRVYGSWIDAGIMARKELLRLDEPLYKAYGVRIGRHPEDGIPELEVQRDPVDKMVADLADRYTTDELRLLGLALEYRRKRDR